MALTSSFSGVTIGWPTDDITARVVGADDALQKSQLFLGRSCLVIGFTAGINLLGVLKNLLTFSPGVS